MRNNIQLGFTEWLNKDNGYAVIQEFDMYGNPMEYVLVRGMFEEDGDSFGCINMDEIYKSKHIARIYSRFEKEMKDKKNYISDVRETLLNLTIEQLESLKPSYYQLVIDARIAELKKQQENPVPVEAALAEPVQKKTRKNATSKTKRKSKKTTETSD